MYKTPPQAPPAPKRPLVICPDRAAQIGLEEAVLLTRLEDITSYRQARVSNGYHWHSINKELLIQALPFWDMLDIQRVVQRLRDLSLLLVRSAPVSETSELHFAFNPVAGSEPPKELAPQATQAARPARATSDGATLISGNWRPSEEVFTSLSQLSVPRHFANDIIPEFVQYWRESGKPQRSWGAKFINFVKRQWEYKAQDISRKQQAQTLPSQWQPSDNLLEQIGQEGIPSAFVNKSLTRFSQYHSQSGTTQRDWDMSFFSWVKEDWQKQDTPFMDKKKSTPITPDWSPSQHTIDYLLFSCAINKQFISDCIPEFIHKWIEKNAFYSEWSTLFAEHVSKQWRFVQAGVTENPDPAPINRQWQPSHDCIDVLTTQSGIGIDFINAQLAEFILYWGNRAEPRHSWDNVFLHHIKHKWAHQHERQGESDKTRDRSIKQQLTDRSWAS